MAVDALEALVKLHADMPGWLEKAEALRCTAHSRYNEFTKMSDTLAGPPLLRKRAGSMESLRPEDDGDRGPSAEHSSPPESNTPQLPVSLQAMQSTIPTTVPVAGKINIDPRNRHLFREVREQRRKRKNPSLKDGHSGPQKLRCRSKIVIYYDSGIQDGFHTLVQSISGARNVLRKARTSASLRPKLLSMKEEESPGGRQDAYGSRTPGVHRLGIPLGNILDGKNPLEVYPQLDRELEAAQTLCEVGAHQALRDGDCFEELEEVKTYFERCIKSIDGEIVKLKEQDEALHAIHSSADSEPNLVADSPQTSRKASVFESNDPSEIAVDGPIEADGEDAASITVDLSELPGRHQYSSKYYIKSQVSSSMGAAQTSTPQTDADASQLAPAPAIAAEREDLLTKYTGSGMDVPIDQAQALAAFITVDTDEPSLDLHALRNSVPRRRQEQSLPTELAVQDAAPEPEFDLAAMRHAALKSRGPTANTPQSTVAAVTHVDRASEEPEFDMEAMKKTALAKRRGPPVSHSTTPDIPLAPGNTVNGKVDINGADAHIGTSSHADPSALSTVPAATDSLTLAPDPEPEFDFASMKKSALKRRHMPNSPRNTAVTHISNSSPPSKDATTRLMVDPSFSDSHILMDEKQSLMVGSTHSLRESPRAQVV